MPTALDEKLRHELGNALMVVLAFSQVIDRRVTHDPVVRDAVEKIKAAVESAKVATSELSRDLEEIGALVGGAARRLSSRWSRPM